MKPVDVKSKHILTIVKKLIIRLTMLLMILTGKKLLEPFSKKNCRKQIKKKLELKK